MTLPSTVECPRTPPSCKGKGIVATSIRAWAAGVSEIAVDGDGNGHVFELAVSAPGERRVQWDDGGARLADAVTCRGNPWTDGDLPRAGSFEYPGAGKLAYGWREG